MEGPTNKSSKPPDLSAPSRRLIFDAVAVGMMENNTALSNSANAAGLRPQQQQPQQQQQHLPPSHGCKKAPRADGPGGFPGSEPSGIDAREAIFEFISLSSVSSHKQAGQKGAGKRFETQKWDATWA